MIKHCALIDVLYVLYTMLCLFHLSLISLGIRRFNAYMAYSGVYIARL